MRVGMGYDVHKLTEGRKLILGGVEIPYEKGLLGTFGCRRTCCMRSWMPCLERHHLEISESTSRIQILQYKGISSIKLTGACRKAAG